MFHIKRAVNVGRATHLIAESLCVRRDIDDNGDLLGWWAT